jgi:hypothetical protein
LGRRAAVAVPLAVRILKCRKVCNADSARRAAFVE